MMIKRKKTALKNKIKTIFIIFILFIIYAFVSNSDYETLKLECKAGLKICYTQTR